MNDLKGNTYERQSLKGVVVVSSGRLKEKVIEQIPLWNKQKVWSDAPLQILKMMVYCGNLEASKGIMKQYPELVYTVIINANKIAVNLNEIIQMQENEMFFVDYNRRSQSIMIENDEQKLRKISHVGPNINHSQSIADKPHNYKGKKHFIDEKFEVIS